MSKLKDFKDKILNWPEKKGKACDVALYGELTKVLAPRNRGFNQAHEIFSNLEFNPAELLDEGKIKKILEKHLLPWRSDQIEKIVKAIVSSKDVVKATGGLIHSSKVVYKDNC